MTDPYKILGVGRDSTEDEINTAYRKLVKQYHPDRYVGNPLAELAAEKIKEINDAYDTIMNERKNGSRSYSSGNSSYSENSGSHSFDFDANKIRMLINSGRLGEAEMLLNSAKIRNAEWHFLMGMVMKKKGWYDMAYQHLNRAASMDPNNAEFRQARDNMDFSGTGYRTFGNAGGYDSSCCDGCQTLICADCCCEMCGGNIIPCIGCR